MLDSIRTRKLLIQIVLGFVIVVFVAFYAGEFAGVNNPDTGLVATVDEEQVGYIEYQNMVDLIQDQQRQFFQGREMNSQMVQFFRQQAVNTLVDRKLMLLEARKAGLKASEEEVRRSILNSPYFTTEEGFVGMEEYKRRVEYIFHMDVPSFERMIAEDVIVRKYDNLLTAALLISDREVEEEYRKNSLTATIDYVAFDSDSLAKDLEVSPEEAKAYYESHKNDFATGELRKVQYLWISRQSDKNKVQISETELKEYYDRNREKYSRPEQVRARHILLKIEGDKTEEVVKKQAEELVRQLRAGADFAEMAKKYSEDPGSKENGGDLGFFERGRMVPEFDQVAFDQSPNEISDPVKSQFGYHIIQVQEKRPGYQMEFALVKDQIYNELASPKAMKNAQEQAQKIHEELTKNKKSMAEISKIQFVELKTTDFFSRNQELSSLGPPFRNAAFELKKGEISEPVQVFQDFAILQLLDTKTSQIEPFEKVEAKVREKVKEEKAAELARQKAQSFTSSLAEATDLKAAAEKAKLDVKTSEPFTMEGYIDGIGSAGDVAREAFSMNPGQIGKPVKAGSKYVVFQLKEKQAFDKTEFEKQKDGLRQQLRDQKENTFMQSYRDMLRKKYEAKIWVNPDIIAPKEA